VFQKINLSFWSLLLSLSLGIYVHFFVPPEYQEQKTSMQVTINDSGQIFSLDGKNIASLDEVVPYNQSLLKQDALDKFDDQELPESEWVVELANDGEEKSYSILRASKHYGFWSLLPALTAVCLCLMTREPLTSLFSGVVVGAFLLGNFNIIDNIFIPVLSDSNSASILLLYLWLLGGLLGIWSRTGAAQAFANFTTRKFVRGPKSAKFTAWLLGIIFFQGGSVSTVLAGVSIKSIADRNRVSHEETSYIIDSTGAPVASLLAFNAWPLFVQALIFIPGVTFLNSELDRINFYFNSLIFSFYSILTIFGVLILSLGINRFSGKGLQKARKRALETGELDAPEATPISSPELHISNAPEGYSSHIIEFIFPLLILIFIAVGSFFWLGTPKVNWAFGAALIVSVSIALLKGMSLKQVVDGIGTGLKGVIVAVTIMMLAIMLGGISAETGGGVFLIDLLGDKMPFYILPGSLFILTAVISFSTGSSWGTYGIAYPLAMPLAWAISQSQGIAYQELYMSICFVGVLNGGVFGDQCSPISDTTILSATTTGCDLMDHVKTQIVPAFGIAIISILLWTVSAIAVA
jgi:Na+/H+ antiporter NhaC